MDKHAAIELETFIANDRELMLRRLPEFIKNIARKMKRGTYDPVKAIKLWRYLADEGAKKHAQEHGGKWNEMFSVATRNAVATELERDYAAQIRDGNWSEVLDEAKIKLNPSPRSSGVRIVQNKMLGGWFVVRGPHQTPISGRFDTRAEAQAWLDRMKSNPGPSWHQRKRGAKLYHATKWSVVTAGVAGQGVVTFDFEKDAREYAKNYMRHHPNDSATVLKPASANPAARKKKAATNPGLRVNQKALQVFMDGTWQYVFAYDQWNQIVTTATRSKALNARRDLAYFTERFGNHKFRAEGTNPAARKKKAAAKKKTSIGKKIGGKKIAVNAKSRATGKPPGARLKKRRARNTVAGAYPNPKARGWLIVSLNDRGDIYYFDGVFKGLRYFSDDVKVYPSRKAALEAARKLAARITRPLAVVNASLSPQAIIDYLKPGKVAGAYPNPAKRKTGTGWGNKEYLVFAALAGNRVNPVIYYLAEDGRKLVTSRIDAIKYARQSEAKKAAVKLANDGAIARSDFVVGVANSNSNSNIISKSLRPKT